MVRTERSSSACIKETVRRRASVTSEFVFIRASSLPSYQQTLKDWWVGYAYVVFSFESCFSCNAEAKASKSSSFDLLCASITCFEASKAALVSCRKLYFRIIIYDI